MNPRDPNMAAVELVANALGPLTKELVLVGGCAVGLLITDDGRAPNRETKDVDLVAEVANLHNYYELTARIKDRGFVENMDHICRWTKGDLIVDVMPAADVMGGSTNRWYPLVLKTFTQMSLPSGASIQLVAAPVFVATKFEAFAGRGGGDYGHHDIEDIVNIVDGRPEFVAEVAEADASVQEFLRDEFDDLLASVEFAEKLSWHLPGDAASQARSSLVIGRMRNIAGL
jgi:predicted nucleotidyltransferase